MYLLKYIIYVGVCVQALKGTRIVDRYALYWSPRPEFVRMAAKFQATIIPFGAVGCEEGAGAVLGSDALRSLFGSRKSESASMPIKARRGVNVQNDFNDDASALVRQFSQPVPAWSHRPALQLLLLSCVWTCNIWPEHLVGCELDAEPADWYLLVAQPPFVVQTITLTLDMAHAEALSSSASWEMVCSSTVMLVEWRLLSSWPQATLADSEEWLE
jgi:hypothetical protein